MAARQERREQAMGGAVEMEGAVVHGGLQLYGPASAPRCRAAGSARRPQSPTRTHGLWAEVVYDLQGQFGVFPALSLSRTTE